MGAAAAVLTAVVVVVGVLVVAGLALAGRVAQAGRESGQLLVAPRGARFGDASRLVVVTARPVPVPPVPVPPAATAQFVVHAHRGGPRAWFHRAA